jgi:hypothetical protein
VEVETAKVQLPESEIATGNISAFLTFLWNLQINWLAVIGTIIAVRSDYTAANCLL